MTNKPLLLLASILIFSLSGNAFSFGNKLEPTKSMEKTTYQIGNTYLSVPGAYFILSNSRSPRVTDSLLLSFTMPGFRPTGTVEPFKGPNQEEKRKWSELNKQCDVELRKSESDMRAYTERVFLAITPEIIALHSCQGIDRQELRKIVQSFILEEKPEDWDKTIDLVTKLKVPVKPIFIGCGLMPPSDPNKKRITPPKPEPADIQTIQEGLRNENVQIRTAAINQLRLHANSKEVTDILIDRIQQDDAEEVRSAAVKLLIERPAADDRSADVILHALKHDKSVLVRKEASRSIKQGNKAGVSILLQQLEDRNPEARDIAHDALKWVVLGEIRAKGINDYASLSAQSQQIVQAFVRTIDLQSSRAKVDTLMLPANSKTRDFQGMQAVASPEYVAMIDRLIDDPAYDVSIEAIVAAGNLGEKASPVEPKLLRILDSRRFGLYQYVAKAFGGMPITGKRNISRLVALTEFSCPGEMNTAENVFPPPPSSDGAEDNKSQFTNCRAHTGKHIRREAIMALRNLEWKTPETENAVVRALDTQDAQQYLDAKFAAIAMGISPEKLIPIFLKGLQSEQQSIRLFSIDGLGELRGQAKVALPALKPFSSDPNSQLQEAAHKAILNIQGY